MRKPPPNPHKENNPNNCNLYDKKLYDLIIEKDIAKNVTINSWKYVHWRCPECGQINYTQINHLYHRNCQCHWCGDNISYPEKVLYNVFTYISSTYQIHKRFSWSNGKIYDLWDNGIIVEIHGEQHYSKSFPNSSVNETQKNDEYKMLLANQQTECIDYIVIDARKSDFEYIKKSIINSRISKYYDLSRVDWNDVKEKSIKSLVKIFSDDWNNGLSVIKIANKYGYCKGTVKKYLTQGRNVGLNDYGIIPKRIDSRQVICKNNNMIFGNVNEAAIYGGLKSCTAIYDCCNGHNRSAGKHPETHEKLMWEWAA